VPRLEPALRQLQLLEPRRQAQRRRVTGPPGGVVVQPHMDLAVQEGAGSQHHGAAAKTDAGLRHRADHPVTLDHEVVHRLLEQAQVGLVLQPVPDGRLVENAVGLRPGRAHGRALAGVEDPELDAAFVGRRAIAPPSASTSLTRWPLPMPPIDGLQLIWPSVSMLCVSSSVLQPMRAAARAASVPAWPPPTTMTSACQRRMILPADTSAAKVHAFVRLCGERLLSGQRAQKPHGEFGHG
jgi:hypothetical protein